MGGNRGNFGSMGICWAPILDRWMRHVWKSGQFWIDGYLLGANFRLIGGHGWIPRQFRVDGYLLSKFQVDCKKIYGFNLNEQLKIRLIGKSKEKVDQSV